MTPKIHTMPATTVQPLNDDEIHRLVDGQATPEQRAALLARLAQDAQAQATVAQWKRQRDALQDLLEPLAQEATPASLLMVGQQATASHNAARRWSRWSGMAASTVLIFGMGWFSHGQWELVHRPSGAALSRAGAGPEFIHQAALAHAAYAPESRHPVEVTAAQQEHLVQWLSKRVGKPLKIPQLADLGYALVGGRLLPGDVGVRAQFMFENATGQRITLYMGALNGQTLEAQRSETAFRFSGDAPIPGFYWVDQGFGYALSGTLSRQDLLALAEAVYRQL